MLVVVLGQTPKPKVQNKSAKRAAAVATAKREAHGPTVKLPAPNLAKEQTLYVVGYAHLDTEWRWEYPQVVQEYLTKTMRNNFALFEKYPHYIFNFTGANRYRLMKEYYPSDFERLKQYVSAGRWFPAGSSMEEGDVNSPNGESIRASALAWLPFRSVIH
jgi:alpha-mannosidase